MRSPSISTRTKLRAFRRQRSPATDRNSDSFSASPSFGLASAVRICGSDAIADAMSSQHARPHGQRIRLARERRTPLRRTVARSWTVRPWPSRVRPRAASGFRAAGRRAPWRRPRASGSSPRPRPRGPRPWLRSDSLARATSCAISALPAATMRSASAFASTFACSIVSARNFSPCATISAALPFASPSSVVHPLLGASTGSGAPARPRRGRRRSPCGAPRLRPSAAARRISP